MLSVNPLLTPSEVREILRETANKIDQPNANYDGNGWSAQYGFGRVNAAVAVRRAIPRNNPIPVTALLPFEGHVDLFATRSGGTVMSTFFEADGGWRAWFAIP